MSTRSTKNSPTCIFYINVYFNPQSGESHSLKPTRELLSECVQFERYDEQRLMEIMHTQHDPPRPKKLPITPRYLYVTAVEVDSCVNFVKLCDDKVHVYVVNC